MERDWIDVVLPVIMVVLSVVGLFSKKKAQNARRTARRSIPDPSPTVEEFVWQEDEAFPEPEVPQEETARPEEAPAAVHGTERDTIHVPDNTRKPAPEPDPRALDIDKKKLIIYSEIMRPKFDEGMD